MTAVLDYEFSPILESLERVHLGEAKSFDGLVVYPLIGPDIEDLDYTVLQEAFDRGRVKVQEKEVASVPEIQLENLGDAPLFALDGEELVGARQNRVLNTSLLIPAKSVLDVPVSCVEQGRWSGGKDFRVEHRVQNARGKVKRVKSVTTSLLRDRGARSNQAEVWDDISQKQSRMSSYSPTSDLDQLFQSNKRRLDGYQRRFRCEIDQIGCVFSIRGLMGLELFDRSKTLRTLLPKILHSYSIEAIEDVSHLSVNRQVVNDFLKKVRKLDWVTKSGVGMGQDWRCDADGLTSSGLIQDDVCLHMSAYRIL